MEQRGATVLQLSALWGCAAAHGWGAATSGKPRGLVLEGVVCSKGRVGVLRQASQ